MEVKKELKVINKPIVKSESSLKFPGRPAVRKRNALNVNKNFLVVTDEVLNRLYSIKSRIKKEANVTLNYSTILNMLLDSVNKTVLDNKVKYVKMAVKGGTE